MTGAEMEELRVEVNSRAAEINGVVTSSENFSESIVFDGNKIQPQHSQTGDISLDIAATGHAEGSSTLVQEIIGNGVNTINLSSGLSARLRGDNLSESKKNRLFYIYDSRLSGDVYNRTILTNYAEELTIPVILSATVENADKDALVVVFNVDVDVTSTTNTSLNFTSGTAKTISSISGSGTNTITYNLNGDIEQADVFTLDYATPSDVASTATSEGLYVPQSVNVTNQVIDDTFPIIASLERRWDSYQGIKEDDQTGFVSGWTDSENGVDILQATLLNQPSLNATDSDFNNKPSITFNGTSSVLNDTSLDLSTTNKCTIVMVMKAVDVSVTNDVFDGYFSYGNGVSQTGSVILRSNVVLSSVMTQHDGDVGANNYTATSNPDVNDDQIAVFMVEIDTTQTGTQDTNLYTDNVLTGTRGGASNNTSNMGNYDFNLGSWTSGSRFGKMNLAATYVFSDVLTAQEKTDLHAFINTTYGV